MKRLNLIKSQLISNKNSKLNIHIKELVYPLYNEFLNLTHFLNDYELIKKDYFDSLEEERIFADKAFRFLAKKLNESNKYNLLEVRNSLKLFTVFCDCVSFYFPALLTKYISHLSLYYNSIKNIGTKKHEKYLKRCLNIEDIGCFGLTEFSHGSNVKDLKTTATFDILTRTFKLNSNNETNYKWWIAGAGKHANMAVIFAKIIINDINYGINPFIVQIRDKFNGKPYKESIVLGDVGRKIDNNGIDNGYIGFNNHIIDYDSMLDKYCQIDIDGNLVSKIKNSNYRFGTVLGALEEGRAIVVLLSSVS
jgi:hypothetical protein